MTVLYFDCFSGASGDMILGALIDAGVPASVIKDAISTLPIETIGLEYGNTSRGGLRATQVSIEVPDAVRHRTYRDIKEMLLASSLPLRPRAMALGAFEVLAEAESKIHGTPVADIHFHEVGALDAIVDIFGAMAGIDHLDPNLIVCSPIRTGSGTVESAHGTLPVPAPAVTEILTGAVLVLEGEGELVTPTAAAILKAVCDRFGLPPAIRLRAMGYGAGRRELNTPNVLRVLIGDATNVGNENLLLLETNIDDMNPELVPYVIESAMRAGGLDAWATPITMKKGRLGLTIGVLVEPAWQDAVLNVLYRETTTLGVRISPVARVGLARDWIEIELDGHTIRVKVARRDSEVVTVSPEYEDAAKAARATGRPLKEIYERAVRAATTSLRL